jgi:hypothetical protein
MQIGCFVGLLMGLICLPWGVLRSGAERLVLPEKPTSCEYNTAVLDELAQNTKVDELIIVVAHLGDGDTRPNLNRRRLNNIRVFFTEYLSDSRVRRKPETVVLTSGERIEGLGRIEFYVGGKLMQTINIRQNADLSVANCAWEPPQNPCPSIMKNFYPCKDAKVRLSTQRR